MTVLGFVSLICFLALVVKYPLRKLKFYRANAFMMKLHEAASLGVFLAGAVQMINGIKNCRALSLISCIALAGHILAVLLVKKRERE